MNRVLIAGCGYVGSVAAELFHAAGCSVEGWTRTGDAGKSNTAGALRALDITNEPEVQAAPGVFDIVVHAASTRGGEADAYRRLYFDGTKHLLSRFPDAAFIFVSSTSVYGQEAGEWVTEESAAEPRHEKGLILRASENLVLERGGKVARFAGVYGPGRSALLRRVLEGEAFVDRTSERFVNQIHREDAAAAVVSLSKRELPAGIFNVADDSPLPLSECYQWLAARLGRPLREGHAPAAVRKRGTSNKRVSNAKLRATGWHPAFPSFPEGMEKSVLPALKSEQA